MPPGFFTRYAGLFLKSTSFHQSGILTSSPGVQLERVPIEIAFYKHFSSYNASPLKLFLPAFQQLECFPAFQQLKCFPFEVVFYTRISAIRMLFLKLFFTSISAVRMLPPLKLFFYQLFSSQNASPLKLLFTSISAVRMFPP